MDDEDGSYVSRAEIEDSDMDSDEADMVLARIYFGEDAVEEALESSMPKASIQPVPSATKVTCISSGSLDNENFTSSPDSEEETHSAPMSSSAWPTDINEFEVIDVASSSSDDYTKMMDSAYCQSSSEEDDSGVIEKKRNNISSSEDNEDCDSDSGSDVGSMSVSASADLSVSRGLDSRPVFDDGMLITTADADSKKRGDLWCINNADKMGSASGSRARYYSKKMVCSNCDEEGHGWRSCPKPKKKRPCVKCGKKDHQEWGCPEDMCFRCMQPGHRAKDCHYKRGRGGGMYEECQRCYMRGHNEEFCSDLWRQYHHTTSDHSTLKPGKMRPIKKLFCYNCARRGHLGHECTMERGTFSQPPLLPIVALYKKPYGTQRHRVAHTPKHGHDKHGGKASKASKSFTNNSAQDHYVDVSSDNEQVKPAKVKKQKSDWAKSSIHNKKKVNKHQWFDDASPDPLTHPPPANDSAGESPHVKSAKKGKRKHHQTQASGHNDQEAVTPNNAFGKKKMKKKHGSEADDSWQSDRQVQFSPQNASTPHHGHKKSGNRSFPQFHGEGSHNPQHWHGQHSASWNGGGQSHHHHYKQQQQQHWQPNPKFRNAFKARQQHQGYGQQNQEDQNASFQQRRGDPARSNWRHPSANGHGKKGARGFKMSAKANNIVSSNSY